MVQFAGNLLNKRFGPTEAETPCDLYDLWKSASDPPMEEVRCWVFLKTPTSSVWVEVILNVPNYFDSIKGHLEEGEVLIEFRAKDAPSPNISPHSSPSKGSDIDTEETIQVTESLSTLGLSSVVSTPTGGSGRSSPGISFDVSELVNDKDPFTMEDVAEIKNPLFLWFPKQQYTADQDVLCVDLDSFEQFVRAEADAGKNLIGLELHRIMCKGGRELNFVCTLQMWLLSILHNSREMRNSFREYLKCSIKRENQLLGLMNEKELWLRVRIWVSDFLDFEAAQERLTLPHEDGLTPFMSPFYFSKEEAEKLGKFPMPNTADLHTNISIMLEGKADGGATEVCASHDIVPLLLTGFELNKGFHKCEQFKKEKKKWVKQQEKAIRKTKK